MTRCRDIRAVSQARLGRTPGFVGSRGGGRPDLWRVGAKWISWSANVGANAHAPDEWVDIEGVRQSARVYAEIAIRLLAQADERDVRLAGTVSRFGSLCPFFPPVDRSRKPE